MNLDGGTWNGGSTTITKGEGETYTVPNPTAGPTYTVSYSNNGEGASFTSYPTSATAQFYTWTANSGLANWNPTTNVYTFNSDGALTAVYGSVRAIPQSNITNPCADVPAEQMAACVAAMGNIQMSCDGTYCYQFSEGATITLPTITKSGYDCRWAKGSSSGTKYDGGSSVSITRNTTFYASCDKIYYEIRPTQYQTHPGDDYYCEIQCVDAEILCPGYASHCCDKYVCCPYSYRGLPFQRFTNGGYYCYYS